MIATDEMLSWDVCALCSHFIFLLEFGEFAILVDPNTKQAWFVVFANFPCEALTHNPSSNPYMY